MRSYERLTMARSIPACAGKPCRASRPPRAHRVHPRVCGEAVGGGCRPILTRGPSPRVRGSRGDPRAVAVLVGSIPACAGKPARDALGRRARWVHPRVCGEASISSYPPPVMPGPSPRVRGSLRGRATAPWCSGSIPACAGKPPGRSADGSALGVHPRVCGEALGRPPLRGSGAGPSPRVRGSRRPGAERAGRPGSIPACAGKPAPWSCRRDGRRVHPRVCGEAPRTCPRRRPGWGPSPRVRGSLPPELRGGLVRGSIPACAGKPHPRRSTPCASRVHPRVCGEAPAGLGDTYQAMGPSPRVRGSPRDRDRCSARRGSIPACAGKPRTRRPGRTATRVHPRVCGEAPRPARRRRCARGPSPRVRGSRAVEVVERRHPGSIPACAGKPSPSGPRPRRPRVHPRVCGEALAGLRPDLRRRGPSPRVRGSPLGAPGRSQGAGSIPACAGKPARSARAP